MRSSAKSAASEAPSSAHRRREGKPATIKEIEAALPYLSPAQRAELDELLHTEPVWEPLPGAQQRAFDSKADIVLFGGTAGPGKTDVLLGIAHQQHRRAIIFRREYGQLTAIEDRSREILGRYGRYVGGDKKRWTIEYDDVKRVVEFGAMEREQSKTKWQGRPHDFIGFDEGTHFTLSQFLYVTTWLRPPGAYPHQRCRIVIASNPPERAEGRWVVEFFAPWLDPKHPKPAKDGELRWFVTDKDGKSIEVDGPEPVYVGLKRVKPLSRTFIRGKLSENPYYAGTQYEAVLDALPEPLRSIMRDGDFFAGQTDDAWQILPTAWVRAAQDRWRKLAPEQRGPLSAIGIDVARGGLDKSVLTPRYGNWFDEQKVLPGKATPDGQAVIAEAVPLLGANTQAPLNIDVIGVGTAPVDVGKMMGLEVVAMNGSMASAFVDKTGRLRCANKRAQWHWSLREALDPSSGMDLAIPPHPELLSDLTAARWKMTARGIQVESKDEIKDRIGRSPDRGESLIYAHADDRVVVPIVAPVIVGEMRAPPPGSERSLSNGSSNGHAKPEFLGGAVTAAAPWAMEGFYPGAR